MRGTFNCLDGVFPTIHGSHWFPCISLQDENNYADSSNLCVVSFITACVNFVKDTLLPDTATKYIELLYSHCRDLNQSMFRAKKIPTQTFCHVLGQKH